MTFCGASYNITKHCKISPVAFPAAIATKFYAILFFISKIQKILYLGNLKTENFGQYYYHEQKFRSSMVIFYCFII